MKTFCGELRFPKLYRLMAGLLSIPCSNADAERGFSILHKIHTDERASLKQSSIIDLMSIKFNLYSCFYDSQLDQELLAKCKKATVKSLAKQ